MCNRDTVSESQLQEHVARLYRNGHLDDSVIDYQKMYDQYAEASDAVRSEIQVNEQQEWNAYGCGYASFLDSWYYRETPTFKLQPYDEGKRYAGVTVVYSLLFPMFSVFESVKEWRDDDSGSGTLPAVSLIDEYNSEEVKALSHKICGVLRELGLQQASRKTLELSLDKSIAIETNLSNGNLKIFDAFYHWMD